MNLPLRLWENLLVTQFKKESQVMSENVKNESANVKKEEVTKEEVKSTPKKVKTVKKATSVKKETKTPTLKKAAKEKAKSAKKAKSSKPRADRVSMEEGSNRILKLLSKKTKPVKREEIVSGTGLGKEWSINKANKAMIAKGLVKREAAKFHDMGQGFVFSATAKGKATAAKL